MRSKHRSIAVLGALVVLALAVSASAAGAATLYEWKVKGAALKSGTSKEMTIKQKSGEELHFTINIDGVRVEFTTNKVRFKKGADVLGGRPGTLEGSLEFENVKMAFPEEGCLFTGGLNKEKRVGGLLVTNPLKGEIVEGAEEKNGKDVGTGKVELRLFAKSEAEPILATFKTIKKGTEGSCGALENVEFWIEGSVLLELKPQKEEAAVGHLVFSTEHLYRNSKEEFKQSDLEGRSGLGAVQYFVSGESETELVSKEVFGAF
jgi:hypothetical protein